MNNRIAVIDLGTNTFHLLIVEMHKDGIFTEVIRTREFVKLAEKGIRELTTEKYQKGLQVLIEFSNIIRKFKVDRVKAVATEGLRKAANSQQFIEQVKRDSGIEIQVISGDEEAVLIYNGIINCIDIGPEPVLMMDIGGGSTEFMIAQKDGILWKQSFPLGAAVLRTRFHKSEPIDQLEIIELEKHLSATLTPLKTAMSGFDIHHLIGASGSFETMANIQSKGAFLRGELPDQHKFTIDLSSFKKTHDQMLTADLEARKSIVGMIPERVDMMVVGSMLINYIVQEFFITEMSYSNYSLKEGIIFSMMKKFMK